jgi:hypothetical protein
MRRRDGSKSQSRMEGTTWANRGVASAAVAKLCLKVSKLVERSRPRLENTAFDWRVRLRLPRTLAACESSLTHSIGILPSEFLHVLLGDLQPSQKKGADQNATVG